MIPTNYKGKHHSEKTKGKISKSNSGANARMSGRVGSLHHFFGKQHSAETKKKMRKAKLGCFNNLSSKPVRQMQNGSVIKVFPSAKQAERDTGINAKNIAACLQGKRPRAGGYEWAYERIS